MPRKSLGTLSATVEDGKVVLSAYKTIRYFEGEVPVGEFDRIRIFRITTDFIFGPDREEYFDGLVPNDSDLIFEGPLPADNQRKFTFIDSQVEIGKTYAYFMAGTSPAVPAAGPVAVKIRDPRVWWPYAEVSRRMERLAHSHPALVDLREIGKTARGTPLHALKIGSGPRRLGLVGVIHAGESGPELIIPALEHLLDNQAELFQRVTVVAVPSVNWVMREKETKGLPWYLRCNANAVDLNRNFPGDWDIVNLGYGLNSSDPDSMTYRGPSPASEPETQALVRFFAEHPPEVVYSYHALASITGSAFFAAECGSSDPAYRQQAERWSALYGKAFAGDDKNTTSLRFKCTSGSLAAWIYRRFGAPCFDIELCKGVPACVGQDIVDLGMLQTFQLKHQRGIRAVIEQLAH